MSFFSIQSILIKSDWRYCIAATNSKITFRRITKYYSNRLNYLVHVINDQLGINSTLFLSPF